MHFMGMITLLVPLASSLVILYILGYVIGQRKRQDVNRAFVLLLADFFMLTILEFSLRLNCSRGDFSYLLVRILGPCAACNGFLLLNFIMAMSGKKRGILYYLSAAIAIGGCIFVSLPGVRIAEMSPGNNPVLPTNAFSLMTVCFIFPPELFATWVAISAYRSSIDEATRRNYIFLFVGTIASACFYFLVKTVFPATIGWYGGEQYSSITFVIFPLVLFRAISKHKFLSYDREKELAHARQIESLGLLAGGIAHDFNNLLTGIMASFFLIKNLYKGADPAIAEIAGQGIQASEQAAKLTRQLLTFAKGGEPVLESVNVASIISEAAAFVLHGSSCSFRIDMPPEVNQIFADRGQLAQVFHNLAMNARQAMPNGGTITVTGGKRSALKNESIPVAPGDYMEIVFADTGAGIDPGHVDRIFEPYFTTKPGGSGLGLATTYSIIKRHKGHIAVSSEKGRGTSFTLLLPMAQGAEPGKPGPKKTELPSTADRILVVDDEQVVRTSLEKILSFLGFTTESAPGPEAAITLFDERRRGGNGYSCCILDLTMPGGINGKELGTALLEKDQSLKIIISSGYHDDPVMARFREYGFAGVLQKPFSIEDLRSVLGSVLANAGAEQTAR
jgi:signal transduction histidine kinase/CheY-like chemotaxis protein